MLFVPSGSGHEIMGGEVADLLGRLDQHRLHVSLHSSQRQRVLVADILHGVVERQGRLAGPAYTQEGS